jgi:hypothetical protein
MDLKFIADNMQIDSDNFIINKYNKLNKALCELIENYSMVGFIPLSGILPKLVEDKLLMCHLVSLMDKSNGYNLSS